MHASSQSRVSPTVLSITLIAFSIVWFISAYVFQVTNRGSKDGVSAAPLWTMLLLVLIPLSVLVIGPWLVRARRVEDQRLQPIDYCALVAGFAPVAILGALFIYDFVS
jgi:uncharacterized membrane protein YhdT